MMNIKRRITKGYFDLACKKYAPLVKKLAIKISVSELHIEELVASSSDEILKCLICFNGEYAFITLLYTRLLGTFRHMRDVENRSRRIINMPEEDMINFTGKEPSLDTNLILQECLECLDKDESDIVIDIYINDKTMREVAKEHDIAASTICRIKNRAIEKMQHKCGMGV